MKVSTPEWWDTTGIDYVPEGMTDKYIADNPDLGIVVLEVEDWLGELVDEGGDPNLH